MYCHKQVPLIIETIKNTQHCQTKQTLANDCWYMVIPFLHLNNYTTIACLNKSIHKIMKSLIDPSTNNNFAIRYACSQNKLQLVRKLLSDPRVDPSDHDNEALHKACERGNYEILKLLLSDERVDPSSINNHALHIAISLHHNDIVDLLLSQVKLKRKEQLVILLLSIATGQIDLFKFFIEKYGFAKGSYQRICLHALKENNFELFQFIVEWTFDKIATPYGISYNCLLWLLHETISQNRHQFVDYVAQHHITKLNVDCAYCLLKYGIKQKRKLLVTNILDLYDIELEIYVLEEKQHLVLQCYLGELFDIGKRILCMGIPKKNDKN